MPDKTDKVAILASTASGVVAATGVGLTVAGFSSGGIVAASTAAGIQAGIGNLAVGSAMATLQSLGASGVFVTMGTFGGVGLLVGAGYGGYKLYKHINKNRAKL